MELNEWIDSVNTNRITARIENDDSENCRWLVLSSVRSTGGRPSTYYIEIPPRADQGGG